MSISLASLGPAARRQVLEQLAQPKPDKSAAVKANPTTHTRILTRADFDSNGEHWFYLTYVLPLILQGTLAGWTAHQSFQLYPPADYCGQKLPEAVFTPDFVLTYKSGVVEVNEIKSKFTKKKSRDYTLRRRLFIDKYCRPQGWLWREIVTDKEG